MWVEVDWNGAKRRLELSSALTRIGAHGCDIEIGGIGTDELHVWCDPPKLIHVGAETTPVCNGRAFQEVSLNNLDTVQWGDSVLVFGVEDDILVELDDSEPPTAAASAPQAPVSTLPSSVARSASLPAAPAAIAAEPDRAWNRVAAGMIVEMGLSKKANAKRWQDSVIRGEFDPDACALDMLASTGIETSDPRLLERAGRLERDLLMMPLQTGVRSAGRKARRAARGGLAYIIAQFVAVGIYTLILIAIVLLLRVKNDYSLDAMLDSWLNAVTPSDS